MSYTEEPKRKGKLTDKGRLYQLDLQQSERKTLERQIRERLSKIEASIQLGSPDVAEEEMRNLDILFQSFMKVHGKCQLLINQDESFHPFSFDEFADKLEKDIHSLKKKYEKRIESPSARRKSEQLRETLAKIPVEKQSTLAKSQKTSSSGRSRSSSAIREAALQEKARLAELKIEAEFLQKQEQAVQMQKMLAKELEIAKTGKAADI